MQYNANQPNHLTKRNNKQQKNNIPYKSAYSYRYLRTYFKRARIPLSYYQT